MHPPLHCVWLVVAVDGAVAATVPYCTHGGALKVDQLTSCATLQDSATDLSLERCTFRNNTAEQSGGALGASSIRDANLTELAFTTNIVSGGVA